MPRILLTGATGFVGRAVRPALLRAGWQVRGLSRDVRRARDRWPEIEWVQGDVGDPAVCARALADCDAALYLVHAIGEGADFRRRELAAAQTFAAAAAEVPSMRRIVYLGGVAPGDEPSEHLQSRLEVGEALRAGPVPAIELRASMIVGHGSLSWLVVRDLAARLPVMVLPRWLRSRTEPVAIDDVVVALVQALALEQAGSAWFDIPGPDVLTGKQILEEVARAMGHGRPRSLDVPLLSPRLSSLWVRFVTRAEWSVARNIVVGLTHDLLARNDDYWRRIGHPVRLPFAEAAKRALDAEAREGVPVRGPWGVVERVLATHGS
ncbi:NAD(P)H-binding protein [Nannocystis bainbridge]|uniref:NAD(P)H-binding protein n=1 Tax=Nannocystis bainbridge TaxID=2995303 RepID=A0ABT5E0B1_9BACT|nr:NAD(P)H-binding protein [Nannocystis bainbridge]MDC0718126.1 NAD(P)H-binding protein [Nannocystis bainbridge]